MSYDYAYSVLAPLQLKRLTEHKYSVSGTTLLDPIFQKFWNWFVEKLPLWLAPNLLTALGLLASVLSSLLLICYSPGAVSEVPRWTLLVAIIGIFLYQTLDAVDGKQARRTGNSSPLGELLDHGCDALTTIFLVLGVCVTLQLGTHPLWLFFFCFAAMFLFYSAHWQTYVSGTLNFSRFDVIECQWVIILLHLITMFAGQGFWALRIPGINLEIKILTLLLCCIGSSVSLFNYFTVIFTGGVGKNGSTVAGTSVLSPIIPIAIIILPAFIIYQKSITSLFQLHPCLYVLAFTFVYSKYTIKLVVAHMTKWELQYLDTILIGPSMLFLNQYFNTFLNEHLVLWLAFAYGLVDFIYFCYSLCHQLCVHLNINMFTITDKSSASYEPLENSESSDKTESTQQLIPDENSSLFENPLLIPDEDDMKIIDIGSKISNEVLL